MNRERLKELLPVMQAYVDGKEIQCSLRSIREPFRALEMEPMWWDAYDYRVKPEAVNVKHWAIFNSKDQMVCHKSSEETIDRDLAYFRKLVPTGTYYKVELTGSYER